MKIRVRRTWIGELGYDRKSVWVVDMKSFLIYRHLKTFDTQQEVLDYIKVFGLVTRMVLTV